MVQIVNRSIIGTSGSFQISVPIDWIRSHRIKSGDTVTVIVNDVVVILPSHPLDKNEIIRSLDDAKQMAILSQSDIHSKPPNVLEEK